MIDAWDHLKVRTTVVRRARGIDSVSVRSEVRMTRRVRVVVGSRLGSCVVWDSPGALDVAIDRAVADAATGPEAEPELLRNADGHLAEQHQQGDPPSIEEASEGMTWARSCELVTAARQQLQWTTHQTIEVVSTVTRSGEVPITRVDGQADGEALSLLRQVEVLEPAPSVFRGRWLLSPPAVSGLLLQHWLGQIVHPDGGDRLPRGVDLSDAGHGGLDLEGTPRRPTTFVRRGKLVKRPLDRVTAAQLGESPTGHGGLEGMTIEDLTVEDVGRSDLYRSAGLEAHVVSATRSRPGHTTQDGELAQLTFLSPASGSISLVMRLRPAWWMAHPMLWVGTTQRGLGAWRSPWLVIDNPERIATLIEPMSTYTGRDDD
jgi:hypothetical protein